MQYKKLFPEDFITAHGVTIGSEGGLATGEYTAKGSPTSREQKQILNIINGGEINLTSISSVVVLNRNRFKERINMSTLNEGAVPHDPKDVLSSGAGVAYKWGSGYVFPEVGIFVNKAAGDITVVNSEVTTTTSHVFIRAKNKEFNYSTNPSFSDIQGNIRFRELKDNPVVYITTIGLYNDNGDLLAVAKVPTPIKKTFHDEVLIQVQLDF